MSMCYIKKNVTLPKQMAHIVWYLTYCVILVITPTNNVDDNDNKYSKLQTRNVITRNSKIMEEQSDEIIIKII